MRSESFLMDFFYVLIQICVQLPCCKTVSLFNTTRAQIKKKKKHNQRLRAAAAAEQTKHYILSYFVLLREQCWYFCLCLLSKDEQQMILNVKCSTYFKHRYYKDSWTVHVCFSHRRYVQTDFNIRGMFDEEKPQCSQWLEGFPWEEKVKYSLLMNCNESLITCQMKLQYYVKVHIFILFFSSPHKWI